MLMLESFTQMHALQININLCESFWIVCTVMRLLTILLEFHPLFSFVRSMQKSLQKIQMGDNSKCDEIML